MNEMDALDIAQDVRMLIGMRRKYQTEAIVNIARRLYDIAGIEPLGLEYQAHHYDSRRKKNLWTIIKNWRED